MIPIVVEKTITQLGFTYPKMFYDHDKAKQYIRLLNINGYEFRGIRRLDIGDKGYIVSMQKCP